MRLRIRSTAHAAILAAMYVVLTYMQNLLLPGSTTWAIQCRLSETLCVLSLFTPAATAGLSIGCLLFNISYTGALPLDPVVGTLATFLACFSMHRLRNVTVLGYPLPAMVMPALFNALLVGWELTLYIGNTGFTLAAFWINALYVAIGELIVLLLPGSVLYHAIKKRDLDRRLFGP